MKMNRNGAFYLYLYSCMYTLSVMCIVLPTVHYTYSTLYLLPLQVRAWKMHIFTIIQVACVGVLWAVKLSPGALAFPFVLILLVPFSRYLLPFMFNGQELGEVRLRTYSLLLPLWFTPLIIQLTLISVNCALKFSYFL